MVTRKNKLAIASQCRLLQVSRSSVYREPQPAPAEDLVLMTEIDHLYLERPFYGSRRMAAELATTDRPLSRKRIQRLMRLMALVAIYPKRKTSMPGKGHTIYPYLLRKLTINRPNQVWAADITYLPMPKGFMYLVAIIDWHSRKVLAWRMSNTLEADFCVEALEEALARFGTPEIFNTDQGAQFTSTDFTDVLKKHDVKISMDGKGRWVDNVLIERLWRSLKYEEVYLKAYESVAEARRSIGAYLKFFNEKRRHQSLDNQTPDEVYFASRTAAKAA